MLRLLFTGVAAVAVSAATYAGSVSIDAGASGAFTIESGAIGEAFGSHAPHFTNDALNAVHDTLHDEGICTDGVVTILLADTDHGLALMALVDDNTAGGLGPPDSIPGVQMTVTGGSSVFINDVFELFYHQDGTEGMQSAAGLFAWDSSESGDAVAWGGLEYGDEGEFHFLEIGGRGLDGEQAFQFVSSTGEKWEVVGGGDVYEHQFGFAFVVIPLPPALAMGIAGLVAVVTARSRLRI